MVSRPPPRSGEVTTSTPRTTNWPTYNPETIQRTSPAKHSGIRSFATAGSGTGLPEPDLSGEVPGSCDWPSKLQGTSNPDDNGGFDLQQRRPDSPGHRPQKGEGDRSLCGPRDVDTGDPAGIDPSRGGQRAWFRQELKAAQQEAKAESKLYQGQWPKRRRPWDAAPRPAGGDEKKEGGEKDEMPPTNGTKGRKGKGKGKNSKRW